MNMNDVRKHYGSQRKAAQRLGLSEQVVSAWNRIGIPLGRQYQIEVETQGILRADQAPRVSLPLKAKSVLAD